MTGILGISGILVAKHCELALDLIPGAKRIGVLIDQQRSDSDDQRRQVEAAAAAYKFTPIVLEVAQAANVEAPFRELADARVDAVVVGAGGFANDRMRTVAAAAAFRLPAIYNQQGYVEAGGLISYGGDRRLGSHRLASFAAAIFEGAKPADLPAETQPVIVAINLKTAKALGLTVPPIVMLRADIVIE